MGFEGKTVIVTGGGQGIGKGLCAGFADAGAFVWCLDIDTEAGEETVKEREVKKGKISFLRCDVGSPESISEAVSAISGITPVVHVLVNNAGYGDWQGIVKRTVEEWDRVLAVDLRGPYLMVRECLKMLPEHSSIINIASTRALMSERNSESYSAAKAGLVGLTHSLAVSLADRKIRVNCVSPGWIEVSGWKKRSQRREPVLSEADHLQHPAGRVGRPEDIAELCLFLADPDKAGFITGQNFVCDGGMTRKMIYV